MTILTNGEIVFVQTKPKRHPGLLLRNTDKMSVANFLNFDPKIGFFIMTTPQVSNYTLSSGLVHESPYEIETPISHHIWVLKTLDSFQN
jgi:hypothetical protein